MVCCDFHVFATAHSHILSCASFAPAHTVAATGDKPHEQRPPAPQTGGAQGVHRRLLPRPAQRFHIGRWQVLRRIRKQATAKRPGVRLLCARGSGDIRQCEAFIFLGVDTDPVSATPRKKKPQCVSVLC